MDLHYEELRQEVLNGEHNEPDDLCDCGHAPDDHYLDDDEGDGSCALCRCDWYEPDDAA